jgi:ABC-type glycerol-3-phosphate transport system substrate-binding protein
VPALDPLSAPNPKELVDSGKALAYDTGITGFVGALGADYTYIGYPCLDGNGSAFYTLSMPVSMSSACRHKDAAWQFIRSMLTADYQIAQLGSFIQAFPTNQSALDEYARLVMEKGVAPADIDAIRGFFGTVTRLWRDDYTVLGIVQDEAAAYFAGQVDVAGAAARIQIRVSLYVSEQG